ncbi:DUF1302 family protein [Zhongshania marina]|uniref:DUF1302 domain-containing protein n=1 Tax=Zhongshania marina TaxID=2304603 RepID=A0A2S4HKE8_9GAMM|nr:DUF1302 family protein [Marortus luteolus]POP54475.1 hypothetical protein C0068_01430 [Marortus luteolus]
MKNSVFKSTLCSMCKYPIILAGLINYTQAGILEEVSISSSGFIRLETAFSTSNDQNVSNQTGNPFNNVSISRQAYTPPALIPNISSVLGLPVPEVGTWSTLPLPAIDGTSPGIRNVESKESDINYGIIRGELDTKVNFNDKISLNARIRGVFTSPDLYETHFDASEFDSFQGGVSGGLSSLYHGESNYFEYRVEGNDKPNPLEIAGDNYLIDFPALFLEYNTGPWNFRLGNQQIAWGQTIFFRVFDVVNGLDLRRHSILDYAQEEFADERVPSISLRATWQATDNILLDGYIQKFQPSVFGNPNTPYNVIASQFTVHDRYDEQGLNDSLNFGLRAKGDYGNFGWQAMAVRRYNPDGVFRWSKSGVVKDLPNNLGTVGNLVNLAYAGTLDRQFASSGEALANSPFEVAPTGVCSATEYFYYAAESRLDGYNGLNAAIEEFEGPSELFASTVNTIEDAVAQLDTFFMAAGGCMRGHIQREYYREDVYGIGGSYVTSGEPGSIFDQMIINIEMSITPDRVFTNPSLSKKRIVEDAFVGALVAENYYRFTQNFPATYLVFQYMYRNADDLVGRSLEGYGASAPVGTPSPGDIQIPGGVNNAQYLAFAAQQPFPQDIVRLGFAVLYDVRGGILLQPGIRWKPSGDVTVEAFYTHIDGDLGGNPNENTLSTLDFADELTIRLGYQF